jgi:L-seryl-tRNA(Ser) seleniumtransferase
MGGVQSGIIAGREAAIAKIRSHPLARAFRCGKMTVLGLEACMKLYYSTERARHEVPTLALLGRPASELKRVADRIKRGVKAPAVARVVAGKTFVGGGSLPDTELDSWTVRLTCEGMSAEELARALRVGRPSVHSRVEDNEVVLDTRTLLPGEDRELVAAINAVVK